MSSPLLGLSIFGFGSSAASVNLVTEAKLTCRRRGTLAENRRIDGRSHGLSESETGCRAFDVLAVVDAFEDLQPIDAHMPEVAHENEAYAGSVQPCATRGTGFFSGLHDDGRLRLAALDDEAISAFSEMIADWASACYRASVPPHIRRRLSAAKNGSFLQKASNSSVVSSTRTCRS